ncbi:putative ATP-dependent helicase IRC20 [Cladorrhinum samala]|uniref:ATP-dependent helicase IRC20 n=1 Tax=Cladorrhinum samala TaxID=585594 RepID=A0AAV9HEJ6_9PEZI|nr:putative ATP-dependent helicase IRC20 [Cladorrhinum samala]
MPRAKSLARRAKVTQFIPPTSESENAALLLSALLAIPAPLLDEPAQEGSDRSAKRHKPNECGAVAVAREHLKLPKLELPQPDQGSSSFHRNIEGALSINIDTTENSDLDDTFQLHISSAPLSSGPHFRVSFSLDKSQFSEQSKTALDVLGNQGVRTDQQGCVWAKAEAEVQQVGSFCCLSLDIQVYWNEQSTIWGSKKANSESQQALRKQVISTWFPDLQLSGGKQLPALTPQDFYGATCIPDKQTFDKEVSSLEIPGLETKLYPFQRRAVQWLLKREGVCWSQESELGVGRVEPYISPAESEPPASFTKLQDVNGDTFYLSPLVCAVTKTTSLYRSYQNLAGGILAEEMGLGKTLEIISLILLHKRRETSVMVFDPFLGRELLSTSATLIVAPSTLLDQWMSELRRHAPGLHVHYYPGLRKAAKLQTEKENSAEYLATQDIIVTTFDVLRADVWSAYDEPERVMRNQKQYERVKSPLVQLSWWRVCIDEAQMVENWTTKAAQLARLIPRVNSWGITGTPVKDNISQDLRGLLIFLRYDLYSFDTTVWNRLMTLDKSSFRQLFHLISMRHTKSLVRNEIAIPPQKRYVITMPFTAVEEQHYQSLFKQLSESCGLDAQGRPLEAGWSAEDPAVQTAMRVALDRLRQTALHPEVGHRNRRALGQKTGPLRTVSEVLDAMLEQSVAALRADQRNLLSTRLTKGQILACQKQVQDALNLWQEVLLKTAEMVLECREQLQFAIQEARKIGASKARLSPNDGDEEMDEEESMSPQVGDARRRLRSALEVQHKATFFCANAYFTMKSDKEKIAPDSDEYKRLERLEIEAYDQAKAIRKEIVQESHKKAARLMRRLADLAAQQKFAVLPPLKFTNKKGLETYKVVAALTEIGEALDQQANVLDEWREHVIQLLLKPLVDEDNEEVTGQEYEDSTKLQDEILVYLQALRTSLADRSASATGQKNFLVDHETRVALRMANEGDGPFPEKLIELLRARDAIKPPFVEAYNLGSLRGLVSELRSLSGKLWHDAASGNSRAAAEMEVVKSLLKFTTSQQTEQSKATAAVEKELEKFMDTLNARIEFYRQLQEISDSVGDYQGSTEDEVLVAAMEAIGKQERNLKSKLETAESKHRYLVHLKEAESGTEEQRMCVICQSTFSIGVLTVCGHQFCKECITLWFKAHRNCPVCKRHLQASNLHDITLKPQELRMHSETDGGRSANASQKSHLARKESAIYKEFKPEKLAEIKNIDLDGPNFTTKVDTLIRHVLWLRQSDPGAKSIVFSQYKEFLEVLAVAFRRYRIGFTSFDKADGVTSFKEDPSTEVFLLSARAHASGLNLVNASHVFLCEPLLNTALELQAIARVDRIGQEHETTVWLYIVDGTVEESIYNLSVQRRLEHMTTRGKGKESDASALDPLLDAASLDAANALEMQQAQLTKLMGKDGISGEAVEQKDLWTCLFGHLQKAGGAEGGEERRLLVNSTTRGFLLAEAAEKRRDEEPSSSQA